MAQYSQQQILSILTSAALKYDVPPSVLVATAMQESGLDTDAVGDQGTSFGLFQEHEGGELVSVADAENPTYAAEKAAQTISAVAKENPMLTWGQAAAAAQRPKDQATYAQGIDNRIGTNLPTEQAAAKLGTTVSPSILQGASTTPDGSQTGTGTVTAQDITTTGGTAGTGQTATAGYQLPSTAPYTGKDAYKGFDLSSLSPELVPEVKQAIDQYLTQPGLEQQVLTDIQNNYGSESWAASDPQIRTLLVAGSVLDWSKDPNLFQAQVQRTTWWQTTSQNQRAYQQLAATDPGQAHQALLQAQARVVDSANQLGVQLTQAQVNKISQTVAQQSVTQTGTYSSTSFSDQQVDQAVAADFNANTFAKQMGATPTSTVAAGTTGATSGQPTGTAADLYNQFQAIAKEYYLPLNSNQIAQQVQKYISGYTGEGDFETGATQGFETYAKQMSANLYPALANIIGTSNASGATAQTPYSALAGYRTLIANYTGYQGDPDTINLSSPQYSWILTGGTPPNQKTASTTPKPATSATSSPALPTYDQVQTYLMQQPAYQTTDAAKTAAWQVGTAILKNFGFVGSS